MYRLAFIKKKHRKHNELHLLKKREYIVGVSIKKYPTLEDVLRIRNKCELELDYFKLWDNLTKVNTKCKYCGKPITTNKPFRRQKIYCSDECRHEMDRKRKRDYAHKKQYKKRLTNDTLMDTYTKLGKKIPNEFNQIDDIKKLGETRLTKHIKTDENGDYDFKAEYYAIRNEKNRVLDRR